MPFHIGGHKPKLAEKKAVTIPLKWRLGAAGWGVLFIALSVIGLAKGKLAWENVYGELFHAGGGIALGILLILISLIPTRWVEMLENRLAAASGSRAPRGPAGTR